MSKSNPLRPVHVERHTYGIGSDPDGIMKHGVLVEAELPLAQGHEKTLLHIDGDLAEPLEVVALAEFLFAAGRYAIAGDDWKTALRKAAGS